MPGSTAVARVSILRWGSVGSGFVIVRGSVVLVGSLLLGGCSFGPAPETETGAGRPDAGVALGQAWSTVKSGSYRFRTEIGGGRITMTGVVQAGGRDSELVVEDAGGTTVVRRIGSLNYVRTGAGGTWVKTAPSGPVTSITQADPAQMHLSIETASAVRWVDGDTVAGVYDAAQVVTRLGGDPGTALRGSSASLFPFEADIDAGGRVAEYRQLASGQSPTSTVVTFSDFGAPVTIGEPPAAGVTAPSRTAPGSPATSPGRT